MATGLIALLDDVAAIAKAAAASLDDVAAQTAKASVKAAGVVIDDTAVTPTYVVGLAPARQLPIIGKIALGSLKNKLIFLLPICLVLGYFALRRTGLRSRTRWALRPMRSSPSSPSRPATFKLRFRCSTALRYRLMKQNGFWLIH